MTLAIFDLDNTLLAGDSDHAWGEFLVEEGIVDASFQEGKVTRLNDWLEAHNESLDGAWFYSDSHNDLPLLEKVDNPVAVDPDSKLEAFARNKGWNVMTLRD